MHVAVPNCWLGYLECMLSNLQLNGQCYTFRLDFSAHFKQYVTVALLVLSAAFGL